MSSPARERLIAAVSSLLSCVCGDAALAQTGSDSLQWGLSVRTRFESKQDFNFAAAEQDYFVTVTRFNLGLTSNAQSSWFVELQDARVAGESRRDIPPVNEQADGTVFADQLDIHQAFWDQALAGGRLRVGRQKFNLGDSRLVASLEWVNTARVHDGLRFTFGDRDRREFDLFASTLVAVDPDDFNDHAPIGNRYLDSDFHGIYVTDNVSLASAELHYWLLYRRNAAFGDAVETAGLRYTGNTGAWRPDLQFALQGGKFGNRDHSAWMIHAGVRREFGNQTLGIAYNLASGDGNLADGKHETFDNLFPLNHPYYGYMDLFSLQNLRNFEFSYRRRLTGELSLYLSLNDFRLAESADAWYNAGLAPIRFAPDGADRHVGTEIDVAVQGKILGGRIDIDAGISILSSASYLDSFGVDGNAKFFYASFRYSVQGSRR